MNERAVSRPRREVDERLVERREGLFGAAPGKLNSVREWHECLSRPRVRPDPSCEPGRLEQQRLGLFTVAARGDPAPRPTEYVERPSARDCAALRIPCDPSGPRLCLVAPTVLPKQVAAAFRLELRAVRRGQPRKRRQPPQRFRPKPAAVRRLGRASEMQQYPRMGLDGRVGKRGHDLSHQIGPELLDA